MWNIAGKTIKSRFLLGSASFPSLDILKNAVLVSEAGIITVSLTRAKFALSDNHFYNVLNELSCHLLPNTAGCYSAKEAINTAKLAREVFDTNWIKLEVIADDYTLQPNSLELLKAAETLIKDGFEIFPYCTDDVNICKELVNLGCNILMPMGSPIGSGQGLLNKFNLMQIRDRFPDISLIIDAGIGRPSDATEALEIGYDGVLLNSAVSGAVDSVKMAEAFKLAIQSGRLAYEAGIMPKRDFAVTSTQYFNRPFSSKML